MQTEITEKQLRSFGLTVGGVFASIGLWPVVIHGTGCRWWAIVVAGLLISPSLVSPTSLLWPYKNWMALGHVLGWINTRIILGLVFFGIVTPMGILRRWLGKDPMGRYLRPDLDSYRIVRQPRPPSHLRRQY
jgi:hypothetical protein